VEITAGCKLWNFVTENNRHASDKGRHDKWLVFLSCGGKGENADLRNCSHIQ